MKVFKKNKKRQEEAIELSSFLERPLPAAEEVSRFEKAVKKEVAAEEVENNLSAIYHDKKGNLIDVSKVKKKKRLQLLVVFKRLLIFTILACGLYGAYYYYFQRPAGTSAIHLEIKAPDKALAAEPIAYEIVYNNDSGLVLSNVKLDVILPIGFVLTESVPVPSGVNSWDLGSLAVGSKGSITISGYLVSAVDSANVISARLSYVPANFSSEFKKEASANTVVSGLGFIVGTDYLNTALIGQDNEMSISLSAFKNNRLSDLYLEVVGSDNFIIKKVGGEEILATSTEPASEKMAFSIQSAGENHWTLSNLPIDSEDRLNIPLKFTFKEKLQDNEDVSLRILKKEMSGKEMLLWEKTISFQVMKSDFNLSLSLNGSKSDQDVNFGGTLEYELEYVNNGDSTLYDLALMAVVKGSFIQWSSLRDPLGGGVSGNAIIWTKEQLPNLAELAPGAVGKINFSLKLRDFSMSDLGADTSITSYAQYGINNNQDQISEDNQSNTIKSQINSDLSLVEKILYFNEDNLPVGSGPLPPRVGERSSFRVFWTIKNNLHDLENTQVTFNLPPGVEWSAGSNTNVGSITYDSDNKTITWRLGLLPVSVYRADAEFNISIIPNESDRDKILVLSSGSTVSATDAVTRGMINIKTKAKTTKLEDDEIAGLSNSGRVE